MPMNKRSGDNERTDIKPNERSDETQASENPVSHPHRKMNATRYPGVYYIETTNTPDGKIERIFYIRYRKDGRAIFEKAGGNRRDDMTAAKANFIRGERMRGKEASNVERREANKRRKDRLTITGIWEAYKTAKSDLKGLRRDDNRFTVHLSESIGGLVPDELTPAHIEKVRSAVARDHAPQTVKNVLELVRRLWRWGANAGYCGPVSVKITLPKVNNLKTEFMNGDEMKRYMEALDNEPDIQGANFLRLAMYTGMRKGELIGLQWKDVDFQREFITIRNPKSGIDQVIPMSDAARAVLETHPRTSSPYVFPGRNGNKRADFKRIAIKIRERAGLPKDFRPLHGLRHNFASTLASSGAVDLYTLSKLMTHKSPQMTQRYAHLRDETLRRAANVFGTVTGGAAPEPGKE